MFSRSTHSGYRAPLLLDQTRKEAARSNLQKFESEMLAAIDRPDSTRGENAGSSQLDRLRAQVRAAKISVTLSVLGQFGRSVLPEMRNEILQAIDTAIEPVEALLRIHAAFESTKKNLMQWTGTFPARPAAEVDGWLASLAQATSPDLVRLLPEDLRKYLKFVTWKIDFQCEDSDKLRLEDTVVNAVNELDAHLRKTKLEARATNRY